MNIHVSNLARETAENDLRQAFEGYGQVSSVNIVRDKHSGESKGFGFVEMPTTVQAEAAISDLHGSKLNGRALSLSQARPRITVNRDFENNGW
jgi:RNA recognition motif-containing protein